MAEFFTWWQNLPYNINPVLIDFGGFQIRYYGLMYMTAILVAYGLVTYRLKKEHLGFDVNILDGFMTLAILGVILGARIGYVLFYNFEYFSAHPLEAFLPYQVIDGKQYFGISGLSYHGGVIGILLVGIIFCRQKKISFWRFADLIIPAIPIGYMFGRIGNFLNGELYGRITTAPWGMYFPYAPTYQLRHPSQLYEAFFEGLFLFCILWPLRKKKTADGFMLALYMVGYGIVRFVIEFYREPDEQVGFVFNHLSMGQVLCISMIMLGATMMIYQYAFIKRMKV